MEELQILTDDNVYQKQVSKQLLMDTSTDTIDFCSEDSNQVTNI